MRQKLMGWQPEHANNRWAYTFGFIGALYKSIGNIGTPIDGWSKLLESVFMAGLCGFAGMLGKWLFELSKKYLTEYFQNRKNKSP
jgi:hypothetical protein